MTHSCEAVATGKYVAYDDTLDIVSANEMLERVSERFSGFNDSHQVVRNAMIQGVGTHKLSTVFELRRHSGVLARVAKFDMDHYGPGLSERSSPGEGVPSDNREFISHH